MCVCVCVCVCACVFVCACVNPKSYNPAIHINKILTLQRAPFNNVNIQVIAFLMHCSEEGGQNVNVIAGALQPTNHYSNAVDSLEAGS